MTERSALVAEVSSFIRRHARADRADLLRAVLDRWPDLSGDELQRAVNTRSTARPCFAWR